MNVELAIPMFCLFCKVGLIACGTCNDEMAWAPDDLRHIYCLLSTVQLVETVVSDSFCSYNRHMKVLSYHANPRRRTGQTHIQTPQTCVKCSTAFATLGTKKHWAAQVRVLLYAKVCHCCKMPSLVNSFLPAVASTTSISTFSGSGGQSPFS